VFSVSLLSLAHCYAALLGSAKALLAIAVELLSSQRGGALLLLLLCSEHRSLILYRTGCIASSAVHSTAPQAGLMCRKCFRMQEAPATKTCLLYLHSILCWWDVFQLNDLNVISILLNMCA